MHIGACKLGSSLCTYLYLTNIFVTILLNKLDDATVKTYRFSLIFFNFNLWPQKRPIGRIYAKKSNIFRCLELKVLVLRFDGRAQR